MPRYFFHLHDRTLVRDEEGAELRDAAAAYAHALVNARALMAADIRQGNLRLDDWIEVVDEAGEPTLTLRFSDAVRIVR